MSVRRPGPVRAAGGHRVRRLADGEDGRSGPTWREFLAAEAEGTIAADFFHVDTVFGKRLYALVFLEHGTRRLHITSRLTRDWTVQQARNLPADLGTRMESVRFLLWSNQARARERS